MAATSASDRHRSGVASAIPGSAGSDSRETAGTSERGRGLEGDQNPWKERDAAARKRVPASRTRRWSKASRPTGTTRVATPHGSCAAGGLPATPRAIPGESCEGRRTRQVWRSSADAAHHHTAPGGNGREAASAGGPSEPPPTLIRRSRRVSPPFAVGFCNLRPRGVRKGRTKRRGGNDRSDAERLPTRIKPSKGLRCEDPGRLPLLRERSRPATRLETSVSVAWWTRNAANPMSGTGTQQARTPRCGESRRGGEKPRGRNRTLWLGSHGPKAHCLLSRTRVAASGTVPGVDRRGQAGGGDFEGSSPRETGPCVVCWSAFARITGCGWSRSMSGAPNAT
jgi:hypothetical protein